MNVYRLCGWEDIGCIGRGQVRESVVLGVDRGLQRELGFVREQIFFI